MKKVFKVMLIVLAICLCATVFFACGEPEDGGQTPPTHTHDYKTLKYDTENHWFECDCKEKSNIEAHKGGTATETQKAVCSVCNQKYGSLYDWAKVFKVNNDTIQGLTDYGKTLTKIVIPAKINGVDIVAIEECAFYNCTSIESVTIPESIKSIGDVAFFGCAALEEIYYNAIECADFDRNSKVFLKTGKSGEGIKVVIGKDVKKIPSWLFYTGIYEENLSKIISVEFEESSACESIGEGAFEYCPSLERMTIGNSVTSIGNSAFWGCISLTKITIPDSVTSIGYSTFEACVSLSSITIGDNVKSIGKGAFFGCGSLTSIAIGESVNSIGDSAFAGCFLLTSVTIPDSVTNIGDSAFQSCHKLIEIYNKSSLNIVAGDSSYGEVGKYAKNVYTPTSGSSKLTTTKDGYAIYPDGADKILVGYTGTQTELTLPDDITEINQYAFYNCDSLTSVTIGNNVTSIGEHAFYDCSSLNTITFEGTISEWKSITKGVSWNAGIPATYVQCIDGQVAL